MTTNQTTNNLYGYTENCGLESARYAVGGSSRRLQRGDVALHARTRSSGVDALSTSNSIFNSAVVPFKKGKYNYAGVFRCDDTNRRMRIHVGFSVDGLRWEIEESDFRLEGADAEIGQWVYGYDPRVAKIGDKYYVTWCNGYHGPTIGIAWTDDFETFHQLENAFLPYNRNGVLFPRKIGGRFAMLSRPSDNGSHALRGHLLFGEPRHGVLGPPPSCDVSLGVRGFGVAVHEDRRGPRSHRDLGGLAAVLPRGASLVQRLCLRLRLGIAGFGGAVEGHRPAAVPT